MNYKVRKVMTRGVPAYQYGHYEMTREPGHWHSIFKVDVHLAEHDQ